MTKMYKYNIIGLAAMATKNSDMLYVFYKC